MMLDIVHRKYDLYTGKKGKIALNIISCSLVFQKLRTFLLLLEILEVHPKIEQYKCIAQGKKT